MIELKKIVRQVNYQKEVFCWIFIIGANSKNEDGLQLADMIAGAIRLHASGLSSEHFQVISPRIVDLWKFP